MADDRVAAFRRPVAPCPSCGEGQHIEPLRRVGAIWFLRCLNCHFGLRMRVSAIAEYQERRQTADRRRTARGGLRATDAAVTRSCPFCQSASRRHWVVTPEAAWARCDRCGRVERLGRQADAEQRSA